MTDPRFILASQSPRRKELLTRAGYRFDIIVSEVDETIPDGLSPSEAVLLLARRKAEAVSAQYPGAVVVGCDTVVALNGQILGKPVDAADAKAMLSSLSGNTHTVFSGVCITDGARNEAFYTATDVTFYPLPEKTVDSYIATGEPMDKAGAYGIQGLGCVLVERISGDYSNVVGLPRAESARVLASFGVKGTINV